MPKKNKLVTLIVTITVLKDEADQAKDALMGALEGDFDCIYSAEERRPTHEEVKAFEDAEFI